MSVRTTIEKVAFQQPFRIEGYDDVFKAGVYAVETDEELLEGLSFAAYRRIRTALHLDRFEYKPGDGRTAIVSGFAFDVALKRDRANGDGTGEPAPALR
jgi:hypothetical protein